MDAVWLYFQLVNAIQFLKLQHFRWVTNCNKRLHWSAVALLNNQKLVCRRFFVVDYQNIQNFLQRTANIDPGLYPILNDFCITPSALPVRMPFWCFSWISRFSYQAIFAMYQRYILSDFLKDHPTFLIISFFKIMLLVCTFHSSREDSWPSQFLYISLAEIVQTETPSEVSSMDYSCKRTIRTIIVCNIRDNK